MYATTARHDPGIVDVLSQRVTALPTADFETSSSLRDTNLLMIKPTGRFGWQELSGYGKRAPVAAAMRRFKSIIGTRLRARD